MAETPQRDHVAEMNDECIPLVAEGYLLFLPDYSCSRRVNFRSYNYKNPSARSSSFSSSSFRYSLEQKNGLSYHSGSRREGYHRKGTRPVQEAARRSWLGSFGLVFFITRRALFLSRLSRSCHQ